MGPGALLKQAPPIENGPRGVVETSSPNRKWAHGPPLPPSSSPLPLRWTSRRRSWTRRGRGGVPFDICILWGLFEVLKWILKWTSNAQKVVFTMIFIGYLHTLRFVWGPQEDPQMNLKCSDASFYYDFSHDYWMRMFIFIRSSNDPQISLLYFFLWYLHTLRFVWGPQEDPQMNRKCSDASFY